MAVSPTSSSFPQEIFAHYEEGREAERLFTGTNRLEFARTCELLARFLPPSPAVIYDVGGGSGVYAHLLAQWGYKVHLVDAVPLHIQQALEASAYQPGTPLASAEVGDACHLDRPDASVDTVLLLGPLYHLTERNDRIAALREAVRVLRPGGITMVAAISRFASVLDGLFQGFLDDPEFVEIVRRDLTDGQHRNPHHCPGYFTTAFFHHPDELKAEMEEAGLRHEKTIALEGPAWLLQNFDEHWENPERREHLLQAVRSVETEPSTIGISAHLMAVGRKE